MTDNYELSKLAVMNQREAVVEAMKANGGYSTLGHLYKEALKIPDVEWKTKTPFKSINRIVQDPKHFFKIRPGLWALLEVKDKLPTDLRSKPKPESDHSYYQGLLVELGNLRKGVRPGHCKSPTKGEIHSNQLSPSDNLAGCCASSVNF